MFDMGSKTRLAKAQKFESGSDAPVWCLFCQARFQSWRVCPFLIKLAPGFVESWFLEPKSKVSAEASGLLDADRASLDPQYSFPSAPATCLSESTLECRIGWESCQSLS